METLTYGHFEEQKVTCLAAGGLFGETGIIENGKRWVSNNHSYISSLVTYLSFMPYGDDEVSVTTLLKCEDLGNAMVVVKNLKTLP